MAVRVCIVQSDSPVLDWSRQQVQCGTLLSYPVVMITVEGGQVTQPSERTTLVCRDCLQCLSENPRKHYLYFVIPRDVADAYRERYGRPISGGADAEIM